MMANKNPSAANANSLEMVTVVPTTQTPTPHPSPISPGRESTTLRNSRCCFHFTKFETYIYVVGVMGIIIAIGKISVTAYYVPHLYKEFQDNSTYYFCALGICMSAIILIWELAMLYFVRSRKLAGLQQWMFAMMLHFFGSVLFAVITGAHYERPGLFLSLSFVADIIRTPPQMFFVHKFIKSEKLNEDSHFVAANYKKM